MAKVFTTVVLLISLCLTSCTPSSTYYEDTLLQDCRNQLSDGTFSISSEEIESILSFQNHLTAPVPAYSTIDTASYAQYPLTEEEEQAVIEGKKKVMQFVKTSGCIPEKDKELLLTSIDILPVIKIDEPTLPDLVYYSNSVLIMDKSRDIPVISEDIALELMRFLRIMATGTIEKVPYQSSVFEHEMAYTILYSHFKNGQDVTGYNQYHQHILDFLGIFQSQAIVGYLYGYDQTKIPQKDMDAFVMFLEKDTTMCKTLLSKWYQQFVVAH